MSPFDKEMPQAPGRDEAHAGIGCPWPEASSAPVAREKRTTILMIGKPQPAAMLFGWRISLPIGLGVG